RVHPPEILHRSTYRVKTYELGIGISAGIELAIFADIELPKVIFRRRRFADYLQPFIWFCGIETQDQRAVPRSQINILVRARNQAPGARPLSSIELPGFASVRVYLNQKE